MGWVRAALLMSALLASPSARSVAAEATCHPSRVALVIGNASYADSDAPLREPIGDAREFADATQRLGFATTEAENLTQDRMRSVIEAFEQKVTSDTVAVVFFTGYGIQTGGHTYLIPVDAVIWNEQDIKTVGFNLDRILSDLAEHGARLRFVIVDGARRNPYERRFRPTGSLGMAAVNGTPGVLALYSSLPGTTFDESGGNTSPFVDALITAIGKPGAQAEEAFRHARADAARAYRGSQTPWVSSFLDEDVALDGGDCRAPHTATAEAAPPAASPPGAAPAPAASPPSAAPAPALSPPAPAPAAQKPPPARPAVAVKVPARPVSPIAPPPTVTTAEAPPPPPTQPSEPSLPAPHPSGQPPAESTGVSAHVAEQTAAAVAPASPPPAPPTPPAPPPPPPPAAPAAPDTVRTQPAAPLASPTISTPAVETPPPTAAPPARPPEQAAAQVSPPPVSVPAPPRPAPAPAPPPAPRQDVALSVSPPPATADDPIASEPIADAARLKEIKDRLYDRGLDPGEPGSADMRNAILTYEKEASLPPSEQPNVRLLSSLRAATVPTPWAAITVAKDFKRWGMSWHEDTRRAALAGARARCGSDDCVAAVSFSGHHCGAFALSPSGWSITWRDDEAQAREAALTICKKSGPTCEIIGAVCADGSGRSSTARTQQDNR